MLRSQLIAFVSTLLFAVVAQAQQTTSVRDNGFSYTYGEVGYQAWDHDGGLDVDVLHGDLSYALDEHLFLRGGLSFYDGEYDVPNNPFVNVDNDVDGNRLSVGMGFNTPLKQGLDLVVTGDIIRDDNDFDDEIGFMLTGGVRHATTADLELRGGLAYEDIYDDDMGLFGSALFHVNETVDVGARLGLFDDSERFGIFGRFNF